MTGPDAPPDEPGRDCPLCPRLAAFRAEWRAREPAWHNAPVPSFGPLDARLLIVGLAPGLRGANRTGRPFTGDWAGDLLYDTLVRYGFAGGSYDRRRDDGLFPVDCRITNAVRCVPPENRPTTAENRACLPFLAAEIAAMPRLDTILALGGLAHGMALAALGLKKSAFAFRHGAFHPVANRLTLADSYHCSRYNTNTRRLTPEMFRAVFAGIRARLA
ncbi:MAG: uracil-DNA glycosylase [Rhodospirillaceae bacterium]|nr:uracil-DNA glycosylase [Rhodospirillaceae bacterium]